MSRARYDNRSGYQSFFGSEAIKFGKDLHDKYYGQKPDCPEWDDVKGNYAELKNFVSKSAGARTIAVADGGKGALGNQKINIGGRQYKLDDAGQVRLLGKDWMQNEINIIQEQQQFMNEVAKSIIWGGDRLAVQIMGLDGFWH